MLMPQTEPIAEDILCVGGGPMAEDGATAGAEDGGAIAEDIPCVGCGGIGFPGAVAGTRCDSTRGTALPWW